MTLSEVGASQFRQSLLSEIQAQKHVTAVKPGEDGDNAHGQRERGTPSPIQDNVTLSKEAHALATSNSQTSKNNSFQQSPSPFDR